MSGSSDEHAAPDASHVDWPDDLDALIAAPDHHTLLFENDRVRVLDTRIGAGDQTPVHSHRWPAALYVIGWSDFLAHHHGGSEAVRLLPAAP